MTELDCDQCHWSDDERAIVRAAFGEHLSDDKIAERLRVLGFRRSSASVNSVRRRMGLKHPPQGRPLGSKNGTAKKVPDVEMMPYWSRQRVGDDNFQIAMRQAGYQRHTSEAQATERPLIVSRPVQVRSSGYGDAW